MTLNEGLGNRLIFDLSEMVNIYPLLYTKLRL